MTNWPKLIDGTPTKRGLSFRNAEFFTEENDHNPLVIANCPHCILGRRAGTPGNENQSHGHRACNFCKGSGIATPPIATPLFSNNTPPIQVACNSYGFLRCPNCVTGFKYYDDRIWSGKRHTCGQRLIIDTSKHENV